MTTQLKFEVKDNDRKYKIQKIRDKIVYTTELESYLPSLYYLV